MTPYRDRKEYQRNRRRNLIAQGFCGACLKRIATPGPNGGTQTCDECREWKRKAPYRLREIQARAEKYQERLRNELCAYCGKPANKGPRGGKSQCNACRDKLGSVRSDRLKKAKAIMAYGEKCADCGFSDQRALEFHHVNFDGKTDRGERNTNALVRQIAKTGQRVEGIEMLCANCHNIRHWDQRWKPSLFRWSRSDPSDGPAAS